MSPARFQFLRVLWGLALCLAVPALAHAQQESRGFADMIPPLVGAGAGSEIAVAEGPDIRLTPDRSQILRLPREIGSIVVGNPATVGVFIDSPQSVVLVPKTPGATHLTLLDKTGGTLLERHVVVAAPEAEYLRIRSTCMGMKGDACKPTKFYYCPEGSMCHDVPIAADSGKAKKDETATKLGKMLMKTMDEESGEDTGDGGSETPDTTE